jgi:argininosuccinate lyase
MPQKKNPDMAELVRGKTGRVYGDLMTLLTSLKGLPLAYNKDMQEDKEPVFDAMDTAVMCLSVLTPMISTMKVNQDRMKQAAQEGFINATDLADYMVRKGLPFRTAYKITGQIVGDCIRNGQILENLPLETYQTYWEQFDNDLYEAIDLTNAADTRTSKGGTSRQSIREQIEAVKEKLQEAS